MTDRLKIAIAQINPTVGAIPANADKIRAFHARAGEAGVDLVVFPELCVLGYPPEDLVLKPAFQRRALETVGELVQATAGDAPAMIVGACRTEDDKLYNAQFLLDGGEIAGIRDKHDLPNYGVFDEVRVFDAAPLQSPLDFRGVRLGLMTCEDMWFPEVPECLAETGAEILIAPHGSPFELGKVDTRLAHGGARVRETGLPLIMVNQTGGQDELVFDGTSFALNADGTLAARAPAWKEALIVTDWRRGADGWACGKTEIAPETEGLEAIYQALVLGLRDYVGKNRFPGVVFGLSGGVDSALTAAIAADALGPDKVWCLMMPSRYTSEESLIDARATAEALGVRLDTISIETMVGAFGGALADTFAGREADATEENIQSRIRGMLVMALSNKFGHMVVATGNKSEMSVGYATLYGDLCGGYAVLKDVYKTTVFGLCDWRNRHHPAGALGPEGRVIPENVITKAPSAELKADQRDEDSLPPYEALDDILECLVEGEMGTRDIVARGHDEATVARVENLLYVAEYKRRQAPPGVKITAKNFGRDRRYPITNGFRDVSLKVWS